MRISLITLTAYLRLAMRLTVQAGIVKLTCRKREILDREYANLQSFLYGDRNAPLYSANKQQALISCARVPVKPHREFPEGKLCESKIVRKGKRYVAMLTFEVEASPMRKCSSILAVDLGERFAATAVLWRNGVMKARFYGKGIRGIRRHYAWLRRRLQERSLTHVLKRIGGREKRCINAVLHRVSIEIVSLADSTDSHIVLGDLTGIRRRAEKKGKGKRFNRIVSYMPTIA